MEPPRTEEEPMPDGQVLEFTDLRKSFGRVDAVAGLTARVEPGVVTGFLGPNGAGKTTTLRMLLGLVRPTSGTARIGGRLYGELTDPLRSVGAVLEASSFHPGRSGANHLKVYAQAAGIPTSRVDEVLALVGMSDAAGRRVGGYSLGMRQRLGLAYALLGDPGVLILDEPTNGLDPEGIKWMRTLLQHLAREGRTVLMSSHLLSEVQQTADALLIVAKGRLVYQGAIEDIVGPDEVSTVVDAPDRAALAAALTAGGFTYDLLRTGFTVLHADAVEVGAAAAAAGVALSSLVRRGPNIEEAFLELVSGDRVHASAAGILAPAADAAAPDEPATTASAAPDVTSAAGVPDGSSTTELEGATEGVEEVERPAEVVELADVPVAAGSDATEEYPDDAEPAASDTDRHDESEQR
jgi:ABC-2 type transport system ATP-binding protein